MNNPERTCLTCENQVLAPHLQFCKAGVCLFSYDSDYNKCDIYTGKDCEHHKPSGYQGKPTQGNREQ